jgi:8-oxo-dGTP diphosphatase
MTGPAKDAKPLKKTTKKVVAAKPAHKAAPAKVVEKPRPLVGVGVIIERDGKILLGKRLGAHGEGTWSVPGGHLEFDESFEACALREVKEELGLTNLAMGGIVSISNDLAYGKHYVTLGFHTVLLSGEPLIQEPHKTERLMWVDPRYLPEPHFEPSRIAIQNWLNGIMYQAPGVFNS